MAENGEPNVHTVRVRHAQTGLVHVWLGDMTGCGQTTASDQWTLVIKVDVTCKDCLHNYYQMMA